MKKRIVFLTLTILWMIIIYWFSAKTATDSGEQSTAITERIIRFFINNPSYKLIDYTETFVRKVAHFTEYFILGGLVYGTVKSFTNK